MLWVVLSAARMSMTGVPEMRRSACSGAERKTRRAVCAPSGVEMSVFSVPPGLFAKLSVSFEF